MITEYRADGWPLCPHCGEDELWSLLIWLDERPPIEDFIAAGLRCYRCGWSKEPEKLALNSPQTPLTLTRVRAIIETWKQ